VIYNMAHVYQCLGDRTRMLASCIISARLGYAPAQEALRVMGVDWSSFSPSDDAAIAKYLSQFRSSSSASPPPSAA
jgi:hypothetical protein